MHASLPLSASLTVVLPLSVCVSACDCVREKETKHTEIEEWGEGKRMREWKSEQVGVCL